MSEEVNQPEVNVYFNEFVNPYKRATKRRVFVNRNLYMSKIKFFGFDMDYTLAEYNSPQFETLIYDLTIEELIECGYPESLRSIRYDPTKAARGVIFDNLLGNMLKVDQYGIVLRCLHGFEHCGSSAIKNAYSNSLIDLNDLSRYHHLNTLYDLPLMYVISVVIDYFSYNHEWTKCNDGFRSSSSISLTYSNIYGDIRKATDAIHSKEEMKKRTLSNISYYLKRDNRLNELLINMRKAGKKIFIVTNSEFYYTKAVMSYLLEVTDKYPDHKSWLDYFDIVILNAKKPLFFEQGSALCQLDPITGKPSLGKFIGKLVSKSVFSGGSSSVFSDLIGATGRDVLFVGDHIFGDILKSKKRKGWRTLLVVPELSHELQVWIDEYDKYSLLKQLEIQIAREYKNLDAYCIKDVNIDASLQKIKSVVESLEHCHGILGSLFRSGSKQTLFASQAMRYADLYAASCTNLLNYPFNYFFNSPPQLMPHESTVGHS